MAYVKNWIHCVWGTKSRVPYINDDLKKVLLDHLKENAKIKGIYLDKINCYKNHIHCIISLNPDQTLAKVMMLLKGESSLWINRNKLTRYKFEWAEEYYGVSISSSLLKVVRDYITNQEEHHRKKSFEDESALLISGIDPSGG